MRADLIWGFSLTLVAAAPVSSAGPSVVLVTLDTTRADRMGFMGSTRGLTPGLDAVARESVVFERAYSHAPITTVSHTTLLSGTYPQFHQVIDFGVPLPEKLPYLPDLLKARGYRTGAFVGSLILDPWNGLAPGFDRGFDHYDAGFRIRRGKEDRYATMERRAEEVVGRALAWLDTSRGAFFLWVHLFDAHDPYDAPAPFRERFADEPYDAEIAYLDSAVTKLVDGLKKRNLLDSSLLAVTADHGEALGDNGESSHGVFLYDATIRVPLLLRLPGRARAGQRPSVRVGLVDVAPTLLAAIGAPTHPAMQGESLLAFLDAKSPPERPHYAETDYPRRAFGWSRLAAYRAERFLYVRAPKPELYDVVADPQLEANLAGPRASVAGRVQEQMEVFRKRTAAEAIAQELAHTDPDLAERLAALGYVGGKSPAAREGGADPKDRIGIANSLHQAMTAIESGDTERAAPLLEKVVSSEPQIPMAQLQLGVARARQRRYAQAIPPLRKAVELLPDSMIAHYEMGVALFETGDWKNAAAHLEIVAGRKPKWADARFSLGSVLARIDRVPEAQGELAAVLEIEPQHYRANLLQGRLHYLQGHSAEALPFLERATAQPTASAEAWTFLAEAYERLGRAGEEGRARAKAQALRTPRS